ncbi:HD domain-containing protein [Roseibium denhamense]|uniref:HDIG domain-containing protein n=1 Tax=Roseibium denhamense TaxID=76305 RepID=A0ABY1NFP5_9HYPH|nr:HD domain-containing phosphohydrolase [Roseibium denhamense]MTI06343.1 HD domain-containing protein [Roseibium denhamense]SMP08455.1 HDIG domain-containing protein [Roseibium denhamense]
MEIVLICDGPLPPESPLRKIPFFYHARLIDMARVSGDTVAEAQVAIVELLSATDAGLSALKASWASIAEIPVICMTARNNRRETIQAAALGKSEIMERDAPLALLLNRIRGLIGPDVKAMIPPETPQSVAHALVEASAFIDSMTLSVATDAGLKMKVLETSANDVLAAIDKEGLPVWLETIQNHHSPTFIHSMAVAGLAGAFARHIGWSTKDCSEVVAGGLIHDIGKTRIPLTILDKAGKLSPEERALIAKHTEFGGEILKPRLEVPPDIKRMALQHHEYLDGSGYPNRLKGERIVPKVRLITLCDIYTALTETRPYKETHTSREALAAMKQMGGKLDQAMLAKFSQMILGRDLGDVSRSDAKAGVSLASD